MTFHYSGQPILASESIFRRLPTIVEREQRIRFQALAYSADTLTHSYQKIQELAIQVGANLESVTEKIRIRLISSAWMIVDHLHAVRQIWNSFSGEPGPNTLEFLRLTQPATALRNKMDHLNSNIPNLAKTTGRISPIFGALSYVYIDDIKYTASRAVPTSGHLISIIAGSFLGNDATQFPNPLGKRLCIPVDLFQLDAFGTILELGPPLGVLSILLQNLENTITPQLDAQISTISREQSLKEELLRAHMGNGYTFSVQIKF